jgi:hypothetical protein
MMRDFVLAGIALLTLTVSGTLAFADDSMQPGKWQITTEGSTTMGTQKIDLPKNQMESCVTPDQVKQAGNVAQQQTQTDCKNEVLSKNGNETKTRTTCPTSTTTIDFTVSSDSYTSITHMEMKQGDTPVVTDMTATGKRVGDCSQ